MTEERPIVLSRPWFDEAETEHLSRALAGKVAGDGPFCRRVERRLEQQLASPRVLLTTSCTHALELALMALGVGPGQEVIVPSFTFVSTANAVLRAGARPVLADIEERSLGLDPEDVERRITPRTKALLPVHYAGIACDMEPLLDIAARHGLKVVEDAAQGLGASLDGRPLGSLSDAGCFSFHETKNITCGEGGALALRDPEVAQRAEVIREKGTNRSAFLRGEVDKYTWIAEGSSYVLSDLLAAVLDAQLDKQEEIARRRSRIAARYRAELADWARSHGVRLPAELPGRVVNHHIFYLLLPDAHAQAACLASLRSRGIGATFHYVPLHSAPFGQGMEQGGSAFPVTEHIAGTLVRLPLHPLLDEADVSRVIHAVRESLE
jgi:dTDP-4-amino-4,6-dideoxygalactose transaminase